MPKREAKWLFHSIPFNWFFNSFKAENSLQSPYKWTVIHICMYRIILLILLDSPGNRQHYIIEKLVNSKSFSFTFPGPQIHYIQKTHLSSWSYTLCNTGFTQVNPKGKTPNWDQASLLCCRTRRPWGTSIPLWCTGTELYFHNPWAAYSLSAASPSSLGSGLPCLPIVQILCLFPAGLQLFSPQVFQLWGSQVQNTTYKFPQNTNVNMFCLKKDLTSAWHMAALQLVSSLGQAPVFFYCSYPT